MNAVILANGDFENSARLRDLWAHADLRVAADGGARIARLHLQIAPHIIIGDLDSLDDETAHWLDVNRVERIQHPRAKNETDLELALALAPKRGADRITILGALGGRIDHTLANIFLLGRDERARLATRDAEMWITRGETEIRGRIGETVSLIPLNARVQGIVTDGLEFPLRGETLYQKSSRGMSNVLTSDRAHVRLKSGTLLIVHQLE